MFTHIDPRFLDSVWPDVVGLLESALKKACGEITIDQIKLLVRQGYFQLFVWHEDDNVVCAGVVETIDYPNFRVAQCSFMSGRYSPEALAALEGWCLNTLGASYLQCHVDDATARLYARYGLEKKYNVLRKSLREDKQCD